jgi:cell division protein FtsN
MIAKFGFTLILAVFGALMFFGGILAPESIKRPATDFAQRAAQKFNDVFSKTAPAKADAAAATGVAPTASAAGAAKAADPIPAEALLIPTPWPEAGQYAVQAGQFADAAQADALGKRIKEMKLPFDKVLDVVDQAGQRWAVVAVGPYASADAARGARVAIASDLHLSEALPLILLPAAKPKS